MKKLLLLPILFGLLSLSNCTKEKDDILDHPDILQTKVPESWTVNLIPIEIMSFLPVNLSKPPVKWYAFVNETISCPSETGFFYPRFEFYAFDKSDKNWIMKEIEEQSKLSDCGHPQYYGESEKYIIITSTCRSKAVCTLQDAADSYAELDIALKKLFD